MPLTQVARARATGGTTNAGGLRDPDTNLVRFGARDYDPHSGRWTAKDAIEYFGIDPQRYQYCFSRPTDITDPTGNYPGEDYDDPCCDEEPYSTEDGFCGGDEEGFCVANPGLCKKKNEKKKCIDNCIAEGFAMFGGCNTLAAISAAFGKIKSGKDIAQAITTCAAAGAIAYAKCSHKCQ